MVAVSTRRRRFVEPARPAAPRRHRTPSTAWPRSFPPAPMRRASASAGSTAAPARLSEYGEGGTSLYWADWSGDGFGPELLLDARVAIAARRRRRWGRRDRSSPTATGRDASSATSPSCVATTRRGRAPEPVHARRLVAHRPARRTDRRSRRAATARRSPGSRARTRRRPSGLPLSADGGRRSALRCASTAARPSVASDATMLDRRDRPRSSGSSARAENAEVRVRRVAPDGAPDAARRRRDDLPARASGYPSITAEDGRDVLVAWTETGPPSRVRAGARDAQQRGVPFSGAARSARSRSPASRPPR